MLPVGNGIEVFLVSGIIRLDDNLRRSDHANEAKICKLTTDIDLQALVRVILETAIIGRISVASGLNGKEVVWCGVAVLDITGSLLVVGVRGEHDVGIGVYAHRLGVRRARIVPNTAVVGTRAFTRGQHVERRRAERVVLVVVGVCQGGPRQLLAVVEPIEFNFTTKR